MQEWEELQKAERMQKKKNKCTNERMEYIVTSITFRKYVIRVNNS